MLLDFTWNTNAQAMPNYFTATSILYIAYTPKEAIKIKDVWMTILLSRKFLSFIAGVYVFDV